MVHIIALILLLVLVIVIVLVLTNRYIGNLIEHGEAESGGGSISDGLRKIYIEEKAKSALRRRAGAAISKLEAIERKLEIRSVAAKGLDDEFLRIPTMDGSQFEGFIFKLCRALGYEASRTASSGDQGVDILAHKSLTKVAIQCKNYARPVGNKPVQEVYAGARFYGADEAWVVAPEGYTDGARTLARSLDIKLYARLDIRSAIERVNAADNPRTYMSDSQIYSALLEQHNWYLRRLEDGARVRLAAGDLPNVGEKYTTFRDQIEDKLDTLTSKIEATEAARPAREAARATVIRVKSSATYRQMAAFADLAAAEKLTVDKYSVETADLPLPEADAASREIVLRPHLRVYLGDEKRVRELMELALSRHAHRYPLRVRVEPVVEMYNAETDDSTGTDGQLAAT